MLRINKDAGNLTIAEVWQICDYHAGTNESGDCRQCPIFKKRWCILEDQPRYWDFTQIGRVTIGE